MVSQDIEGGGEHGDEEDEGEDESGDMESSTVESEEEERTECANDALFTYLHPCPFFRQHHVRLVSVLHCWRALVQSGAVGVGPHGVEGSMAEVLERVKADGNGLGVLIVGRCW